MRAEGGLASRAWWAVVGAVAFLLVRVGTIADGVLRLPGTDSLSAECEARSRGSDRPSSDRSGGRG
jgi:hypothetical protein